MKRDSLHSDRWPAPPDTTEHAHALKKFGAKLGALVRPAIASVIPGPPADYLDKARERGELLDELLGPKAPVINLEDHRKPESE